MRNNQKDIFYYSVTIVVALLGFWLATDIKIDKIIVNGILSGALLCMVAFYVTHTFWDYSFGLSFNFLSFLKSMFILFILAVIVSWAIENVFSMIFYVIGI